MNQTSNELVLFFGRFHPLLVHLPIGFLVVAALMEVFALFKRFAALKQATEFVLFLAAGASVLAALFGYFLSLSGGYDQDLLAKHQWLGLAVAGLAVVAYVAKARKNQWVYAPSLMAGCVVLTLAGHFGGELTHGSTYLTEYMPAPVRNLVGLPPKAETTMAVTAAPSDPNQAVVFAHVVQPILKNKCENCHNANKQKGALRMDSYDYLSKGGENGPVFAKGKSVDSEMIKRCQLPEDNDDHMPPKGKPQLTKEELAILAWWIDQGGSADQKLADLPKTPAVETALKTVGFTLASATIAGVAPRRAESEVYQKKLPAADATALLKLKALGILAQPVAEGSSLIRIQAGATPLKGLGTVFGDQQLALLAPLAQNIVWLDLGSTQVTDKGMAQLVSFPHLVRLHLQKTAVTDAGLAHLAKLPHLEYLNLYGTAVTDAGIGQLAPLQHLHSLYLWQTKVSMAGAKALRDKIPRINIDQGFQAPDSVRTKPEEKKKV